ncbi:6919_t:CDS:1, partial [Gigaspora rosea]
DFQNEKKKLKEEKLHYNDSKEPRDASCTGSDMGTKAKVDEPENGTTRPI